MIHVLDMRHEQDLADSRTKVANGRTVLRDPATVTGIVLHQTAVVYVASKLRLKEAGGNRPLALARRVVKGIGANPGVPAHCIAMREGFVIQAFDMRAYCYHANALNATTLGLEIEGAYPGLGHLSASDAGAVESAKSALRLMVEQGRALGMPLEYLFAHRQSSPDRRADPGQGLWEVLEPFALELGLRPQPSFTVGQGRTIPVEWSTNGVGHY